MVDIRVNENSFPFVHDWDEDGRKDLVLGESHYNLPDTGNVRIYKNSGTNSQPRFTDHFLLRAGGQLLFHPRANPTIYDLDRDGVKDLVLGNDNGYIYFYCNIGTNQFPVFAAEYETLQTKTGEFIDALTESRLRMLDWNADDDLDLLLGGQDGYVWIYENATDIPVEERGIEEPVPFITVIPNPFRNEIRFMIQDAGPKKNNLSLKIHDASGRLVEDLSPDLVSCIMNHGTIVTWNGKSVPAGVYFIHLRKDDRIYSKKIVKLQ